MGTMSAPPTRQGSTSPPPVSAVRPSAKSSRPPVVLGVLLAILGAVLAIGGLFLMTRGESPYFAGVGVGLAISGVLLARGRKAALGAYFVTLLVILVWSAIETGGNLQLLLPRIALPLIVGLYLSRESVRARLS